MRIITMMFLEEVDFFFFLFFSFSLSSFLLWPTKVFCLYLISTRMFRLVPLFTLNGF